MTKTTVALTSREHAKLKALCRQKNITLTQLVESLIEKAARKQKEARP